MPEQRRRFSPQFKAEAVQMVIETGKPIAQPHRGLINNPRNCPRFLTRPNNRGSRGSDHDDRWPEVGTIRDG